jgi:amino acid adenylation domain-containing protein
MTDGTTRLAPSFAQELLWLTERASPGSTAYSVPRTRRLRGPLDVAALRRAFDALAARHEILRTTYGFEHDQPVQMIHPAGPVAFELVDLSMLPADAREAHAQADLRDRSARPFDLSQEPPLRVGVVRLAPDEHLLHINSHHIAADGWSRDVLFRDLGALYTAFVRDVPADLPDLPIQYADFAVWQREQLSGDHLEQLLGYWRHELGDAEYVLDLPTDFPRPPVAATEGVSSSIDVPEPLLGALRRLGQQHEATLYMTLLAGYTMLLHRYSGKRDVLVGSPVAGRSQPETEGLIGYFANTIVQRGRFGDDPTFEALLRQIRESALGAYEHQEVPFEKLVLELQGGQSLSHTPLFQVVFTMLEAADKGAGQLGDITVEAVAGEGTTTKFDLTLFMAERNGKLTLTLRARTDLFTRDTIEQMLARLQRILQQAVDHPAERVSQFDLLTPEERTLLRRANDTAVDLGPATTITALIEAAADCTPETIALVAGKHQLTWAQFEREANRLAHHLRASGAMPGESVGICLERSADAIVALLAVLKTGAAYVPLATDAPAARLAQQLTECGARVVVTRGELLDRIPADLTVIAVDRDAAVVASRPDTRPVGEPGTDSVAYVLFTSGSTGTPKGVAVTHANIVNYTRAISRVLADVPASQPGDGLAALAGWSFGMGSALAADLGNTALFPALCAGGTLHLLDDATVTEPARFAAYLAGHSVDVLKLTPNHLRALTGDRTGAELAAVLPARWLVLGGEALSWELADRLNGAGRCRLLNHYGPTEATVGASTYRIGRRDAAPLAATVPIGQPLANLQLHVLDAQRESLPPGIPGELFIAGAGVAQGYLNRPDLTAERFVELVGIGRAYRTGDRVRRVASGDVEFLGRVDHQVKVRGYRVELGEIEHVVGAMPGVAQCAVILRDDPGAGAAVACYVVPRTGGYAAAHAERPSTARVQEWVRSKLPEYMVPSLVIVLDELPLTRNGKLDRAALPSGDPATAQTTFVAPATETEQSLRQIWADALKRDPDMISTSDDFLALGGHSLVAIRILGKISRAFGLRLPLRTLFDAPRIDQLAELVDLERQLAALDNLDASSAGAAGQPPEH